MRKIKNLLLPSFSSGFAALAAREAKASKPDLKVGRSQKETILALGAESAGNFSVLKSPPDKGGWGVSAPPRALGVGGIYHSPDFGDLLEEKNFKKFQTAILIFLKKNKLKPNIILTDLHPEYRTTLWGAELAKKFKAKHVQVQHHIAHIFSAVGEDLIFNFQFSTLPAGRQVFKQFSISNSQFFGIALDGTGYGFDGKIWGSEIFEFPPLARGGKGGSFKRIGHLENQVMIGGDLAVREPARMLISILNKFSIFNFQSCLPAGRFSNNFQLPRLPKPGTGGQAIFKTKKDFIYYFIKKYYTKNQFELLYNQLQNNFNCIETSSTGRILDAVSILLGFCGNERNYKHEPADLLEKNSTIPYKLPPLIKGARGIYILETTPLFQYLIKNLNKDKRRLAATAQLYIAQGLYEIIKKFPTRLPDGQVPNPPAGRTGSQPACRTDRFPIYLSGGLANNKIISSYLESKGVYVNKKIPRGDGGISFGQVWYYLFSGDANEMSAIIVPSP